MSYYECIRCCYRSSKKIDMVRHLERKIKCPKIIDSYKYSEDDINKLSLTIHKINDNSEKFICKYCTKTYTRKDNLNKHVKTTCKNSINNVIKEYNYKKNLKIDCVNIEKQLNIGTNIENQTNILILNPSIQPFDNQWSTEHIDKYISQVILMSENKYTNLLGEILKNKENLNVIIEKDSNYGLVYKNEDDMYVNMKVNEIIEKSMQKLHEQLNIFYTSLIKNDLFKMNTNIIDNEKEKIDNKFQDFCNNNIIKNHVEKMLENIYDKNREEAIEIAEKVLNYKDSIDNTIGY